MMTTMITADTVERFPHNHRCRNALYLPREVIFNILIFVPAEILYKVMRYVCKQWYDIIINPIFATTHCQMCTPNGFLIQYSALLHKANHIEPHTGILNETPVEIPFRAAVVCCFNGLLVLHTHSKYIDTDYGLGFHVVNPVTKVIFRLPHGAGLRYATEGVSLAVDSSGHYKVVHVSGRGISSEKVQMRVFTIGVDKAWRFIDLQGIPVNPVITTITTYESNLMKFRSFCFGGFIYWFTYYTSSDISPFGFALDVDTEIIYPLSMPTDVVENRHSFSIVSTETGLVLMTRQDVVWRVWKLTDVKSSEWIESAQINVTPLYNQIKIKFDPGRYFRKIIPVRLFKGDLWLHCFCTTSFDEEYVVVRYNLAGERFEFFLIERLFDHALHPYANTLISPKNC